MGNSSSSGCRAQPKVGFEDTAIIIIIINNIEPPGVEHRRLALLNMRILNCNVAILLLNKEGFGTQSNFGCSHVQPMSREFSHLDLFTCNCKIPYLSPLLR